MRANSSQHTFYSCGATQTQSLYPGVYYNEPSNIPPDPSNHQRLVVAPASGNILVELLRSYNRGYPEAVALDWRGKLLRIFVRFLGGLDDR